MEENLNEKIGVVMESDNISEKTYDEIYLKRKKHLKNSVWISLFAQVLFATYLFFGIGPGADFLRTTIFKDEITAVIFLPITLFVGIFSLIGGIFAIMYIVYLLVMSCVYLIPACITMNKIKKNKKSACVSSWFCIIIYFLSMLPVALLFALISLFGKVFLLVVLAIGIYHIVSTVKYNKYMKSMNIYN